MPLLIYVIYHVMFKPPAHNWILPVAEGQQGALLLVI